MGQDQSNTLDVQYSLSVTPSSSTTSRSRSILQIKAHSNQHEEDDDNEIRETSRLSEEEEEGIIKVVEGTVELQEEEEMKLMRSIKRFDPFIKEQEKSFSLENMLLGLKTKGGKPPPPSLNENDVPIHPAIEMFFDIQAHLKEHMTQVNNEQRILLRRIAYVDELSNSCAQTISKAYTQTKAASDRVTEVATLKEQAFKAQTYAIQIFKSLSALEKHLDPQDRISSQNSSQWPVLDKLRMDASKSTPFDRLKRTSSTTNDLTTVGGTSTSPLLEKVVVVGEPATFSTGTNELNRKHSDLNVRVAAQAVESSSSSLALNRLRGLSSRSIRTLDTNNDS